MSYMDFSSNHFHGTIPSSMGEMKSLITLDVSSNGLSGELPKTFLSSCYSLEVLKLSNNKFQGEIFPEQANLTGLNWLYLDGNRFNGSLVKGLLNSKKLFVLDVSKNSISGSVPLWLGNMSSLAYLYMRGNQLEGPFPQQLQNLFQLMVIDLSHNSFSGSIPRNLDFPQLRVLSLGSNEFMGSVPGNLLKAENLLVLDLGNNNFSGKFLGKRSSLRILLLRNNSFQSDLPEAICELSEVGLMDLSHNKFKGVTVIPSCLGNMSFGAERYETSFGPIFYQVTTTPFLHRWSYTSPLYLDNDYSLADDWKPTPATIVDFLTKNRAETYQGDILEYMYGLDLSSNQLSGEIPLEFENLESIRSLNLSSNRLTGSIPDSISKLKDLESLDLSNNKLNGNIPSHLADIDSLGYFDVSFNNLSGEIPFSGHLQTFGEMSYIGNAHLCGQPTNNSCNSVPEPSGLIDFDRTPKHAKEEEEEGDSVMDMMLFYWTCGGVYISTLLALSAFLFIDSPWSREWFYRVDLLVHHLQRFKGRFACN